MNSLDLKGLDLQEMSQVEMRNTDGGFVPLVIFGIAVSAKAVAGAAVAAFGTGVAIGAAAYLAGR